MKMNKSEKIFERCRVQKDINEIRDGIWTTNHSVFTSTVTLVFISFLSNLPLFVWNTWPCKALNKKWGQLRQQTIKIEIKTMLIFCWPPKQANSSAAPVIFMNGKQHGSYVKDLLGCNLFKWICWFHCQTGVPRSCSYTLTHKLICKT